MTDLLNSQLPRLEDLLPAEVMARLTHAGKLVRYRDGETVHRRGDNKPGLSIVKAGGARTGIAGLDGSFLTSSTLGPGHCFGEFTLFAGLPRTHDITAEGDTEILQIPGARFFAVFDDEPRLARALLTVATLRNHHALELIDDLRRLPLEVRVAKLLYALAPVAEGRYTVKRQQEELAFAYGVTRVSIGKVLKRLAAEELIATGYGCIEVTDTARLRTWLDERMLIAPVQPLAHQE